MTWWANANGNGETWTPHVVDNAFSGAYWVASADVDYDGDLDVLGASINLDQVPLMHKESRGDLTTMGHTPRVPALDDDGTHPALFSAA
jgi:hypothetical protein